MLNSTWKMSRNEVERVNNCRLKQKKRNSYKFDFSGRQKELYQRDAFFWGHHTDIKYYFFDDMLYKYEFMIYGGMAYLAIDETEKIQNHRLEVKNINTLILKNLQNKFGKEDTNTKDKDKNKDNSIQTTYKWIFKNQKITYKFNYWDSRNVSKKGKDYMDIRYIIIIEGVYQPIFNEMNNLIEKEKANYF